MGIYYTSYAILGVKVDARHLVTEINVANCGHSYPKDAKFCPTCGNSTGMRRKIDRSALRDILDIAYGEMSLPAPYDDGPFEVITGQEESDTFYFGITVRSDCDVGDKMLAASDLPTLATIIAAASDVLTSLKVWSDDVERSFGLYSVTIGR